MPCGHLCVCADCGNTLKSNKNHTCPICRGNIDSLVNLDMKNLS